jgi:hypothetical protein
MGWVTCDRVGSLALTPMGMTELEIECNDHSGTGFGRCEGGGKKLQPRPKPGLMGGDSIED